VVKVYIDDEYEFEEEFTIYPNGGRYKCEIPAPGMDYVGDEVSFYVSAYSAYDSSTDSAKHLVDIYVPEPILCTDPDPPSHGFGSVPEGQTRDWSFDITNCGAGTLTWTVSDDQSWITVTPPSGSTTTESDAVTVTIDTTGLGSGVTHTGTVTVSSNGGTKQGLISVYVPEPGEGYIFITKWGSFGTGDEEFRGPSGIAVDSSGNVFVADRDNSRIQKFDTSGNFMGKWGSYGSGDGQFSQPLRIAVDSSGNVFVADRGNERIQKFDSIGNFIGEWGSYGSGDGQFDYLSGIAVDNSGNVFVADRQNHRIQKFDSNGNFIGEWGSHGSGDGEFYLPGGIAVDSSGNVFVADTCNDRIQKFDSSGNFIGKWGSYGSGDGEFSSPEGIRVDSSGNVFVVDSGNSRIQKFDSYGNCITKWGVAGTGDGQFDGPFGIAVDDSGYVYVTEMGNNRIQKFAHGIPEEPSLSVSPSSHDYGDKCEGETDNTTFEIWNSGTGTLTYSLSETCDWLDVNPASGSSTGEHDTITVDINTTGLSEGTHTCDITISSNDGTGTFTVTVNVVPCPCGDMTVNPTSWNPTINCSESDSQILTVSASGGIVEGVTVGKISGPTWLSVSPTNLGDIPSGSSKTLTMTASPPSETSGDFGYTVRVSNTCGSPSSRDVAGTINVNENADGQTDYWAVIVGVADYTGTSYDLAYTDDDAIDMYNTLLLSDHWQADHIMLLLDSEADRAGILAAFNWLDSNEDPEDVVLFFFSGHGTYGLDDDGDELDGWDEFICPYDFNNI
jgi:hypothetical protein